MSYVPDALAPGSYVPPVVGGLRGALGPSFVPPALAGAGFCGPSGITPFGFGGPGQMPVHDVPGRIAECKDQWQQCLAQRASQAKEQATALAAARGDAIDRACNHELMRHAAQTNARRQAAKLQVHSLHQQQHASIDRCHAVQDSHLEQRAQSAAHQAQQRITQVELQAQQYWLQRDAYAAQAQALSGHAQALAGIAQRGPGGAYGYLYGTGYSGFGGYAGIGGYAGFGGYAGYGGQYDGVYL